MVAALRLLRVIIVLGLFCGTPDLVGAAKQVTHKCRLHLAAEQQELQLSCQSQPGTPASCNLVVYYNSTVMPLRSTTPFGIPSYRLPKLPENVLRSAAVNKTEEFLNRTEPIYNATTWPLLFFHGGPSCHAYFKSPLIRHVDLPRQRGPQNSEATQLLMFGGGMSATLEGGEIVNNSAFLGVTALANTTLTVLGTNISYNDVLRGTLYGSYTSQLFLRNVTLSHNKAEEGAAMYLVNSRATITTSTITSNTATIGGGALYVKGNSSLFLRSSTVSSNTSPSGGAVYASEAPMVAIWQCQIQNNTARSYDPTLPTDSFYSLGVGGGLFLQRSTADIRGSNMTGNKAVMDGGAIHMHIAELNISGSWFTANRAYRHGGAIYVGSDNNRNTNSTVWVTGSVLADNLAEGNGGGMMLERRAHVRLVNSTIRSCKAYNSGDGICTVMGAAEDVGNKLQDDLQTQLVLDDTRFEGAEVDEKLFIGPYFNITFSNPRELNRSSYGVMWRRRLCSKGEYVSATSFCMLCPTFQFSTHEAYPGHNLTDCVQAPNSSYAPGGAVLVALPKFWHGVDNSVNECSDCPPLVARLNDTRRCPNPSACQHDPQQLGRHHPNSLTTADRWSWQQYSDRLCSTQDGYSGVLCGVCIKGFGMTSPFACERCLGAQFTPAEKGNARMSVQQPGPTGISLLYTAYWLLLVFWLLVCVRFSNPRTAKARQGPAPETATEQPAKEPADNKAKQNVQPCQAQDHTQAATADGHTAPASRDSGRSLDITKALLTYTQWAMLILTLPIDWQPWSNSKAHSGAGQEPSGSVSQHVAARVLGVLFGRAVPLDCFFQSWDLWQADTMQQIVTRVMARAVGSAVIVPLVLFLSVMLLQLLFLALRQPMLRALEMLFANSAFFRNHLSGMVTRPISVRGSGQSEVSCDVHVALDGAEDEPGLGTATSGRSCTSRQSSGNLSFTSQPSDDFTSAGMGAILFDSAISTALAVMLFTYSTIAKVGCGLLMCIRVGMSRRWILDVRLQCPTSEPTAWGAAAVILGVFLLCVCIAWPVGIACMLVHKAHRGELLRLDANRTASSVGNSAARTTARLAVRYADYDVDYEGLDDAVNTESMSSWYRSTVLFKAALRRMRMYAVLVWDSILELHKFTLVFVSLCVMLHELHQLTLMIVVLGSYLVLVLLVEPWRSVVIWRLQVTALVLLLGSCMGIAVCSVNDAASYYEARSLERYQAVIPWVIVGANLCYLAVVMAFLVRCLLREAPKVADVRRYLRRRLRLRNRQKADDMLHGSV